jgi:hypothetical protein
MATGDPLVQIEGAVDESKKKVSAKKGVRGVRKRTDDRVPSRRTGGCSHCPLNRIEGVNKIFGKVEGKAIFVWGQSPGKTENKEKKELVGESGKWWWREAKAAGITRDMCDIQNVVRCFPVDVDPDIWPPLVPRHTPSKEEIKCCSVYNQQALEKSKAHRPGSGGCQDFTGQGVQQESEDLLVEETQRKSRLSGSPRIFYPPWCWTDSYK